MENFQSVFDAYPDTQTIYVVGEMPFLQASHAESHSRTTGVPVRAINRPTKVQGQGALNPVDPEKSIDPVDPGKPVKAGKGKGKG